MRPSAERYSTVTLAEDVMGVAISNRRLISLGDEGVTFKWKD